MLSCATIIYALGLNPVLLPLLVAGKITCPRYTRSIHQDHCLCTTPLLLHSY
ncbi:hypothetical protein PF005_g16515 [Phytophthora fragariae]|uniref:RxLR effector protein n=2 Tax=Phytophthora TaxID=4783 RepID=A0A6A4CQX2_9STRA|nr:hypothetical protein PF003_g29351 [Phytophthora fragariae]KAE8980939.1 hypothetical protein PR001_g24147 [Phytophthora rubi]KAE8934198.1 hypothetical protein PF009_g15818 [Phytophthora fragariae]KAE8992304.1 hypothetical protein PF011_g17594 [Phytophthora fragariae]KAE9010769.1 hypothetical protein PR002_g15270 [Phytophthora rubi]